MGNAEPVADLRDHFRLGPAFASKGVIDRRSFDPERPRLGREKKQSETVGTARDSKADGPVGRYERREIAPETLEER
jgi:hypothetical protein